MQKLKQEVDSLQSIAEQHEAVLSQIKTVQAELEQARVQARAVQPKLSSSRSNRRCKCISIREC